MNIEDVSNKIMQEFEATFGDCGIDYSSLMRKAEKENLPDGVSIPTVPRFLRNAIFEAFNEGLKSSE